MNASSIRECIVFIGENTFTDRNTQQEEFGQMNRIFRAVISNEMSNSDKSQQQTLFQRRTAKGTAKNQPKTTKNQLQEKNFTRTHNTPKHLHSHSTNWPKVYQWYARAPNARITHITEKAVEEKIHFGIGSSVCIKCKYLLYFA